MRDGNGQFSLLAEYNPVVTGTPVSSDWANNTLADVAEALSDSICVDGQTPMTGPLRLADGTGSAPSLTFTTEPGLGIGRAAAGTIGFASSGGYVATMSNTLFDLTIDIKTTGNIIRSVEDAATATGTDQAGASLLTADINVVTSSSGSALGVLLPTKKGAEIIVFNNTVNDIYVYPQSGGVIDFRATDEPYLLSSHGRIRFISYAADAWLSLNASLM